MGVKFMRFFWKKRAMRWTMTGKYGKNFFTHELQGRGRMSTLSKIIAKAFLFIVAYLVPVYAGAEDYGSTARGMFILLPPSIFENTPEGLSDFDKHELLARGKSHFWEITNETPNHMVFTALPLRDRGIGLRIFRNDRDGSTEIAVGTFGEPVCSVEMWRLDLGGRLVPVDTPEEPRIKDFFGKDRRLGKHIRFSAIVCLGNDGLYSMPLFWNESGMLPSNVDNNIRYRWNGHEFEKQISERGDTGAKSN